MAEQERDPAHRSTPKGRGEMHRRQRGKNIAVLLALAGMVALFYVLTIVRMGGSH
ncbi:MAG: hypothetical protein ABI439_00360 [Rhodospirillales bacterium]